MGTSNLETVPRKATKQIRRERIGEKKQARAPHKRTLTMCG